MPRGRRWTEAEDSTIERATFDNTELGILHARPRGRARERDDYAARLRRLADQLGRTYAAVLKRAQRIGAASYAPRERGEPAP